MTNQTYRSRSGKIIDVSQILLQNEDVIAIGNMKVNARGDELGRGGRVVRTREQIMKEYYALNTPVALDELQEQTTQSRQQTNQPVARTSPPVQQPAHPVQIPQEAIVIPENSGMEEMDNLTEEELTTSVQQSIVQPSVAPTVMPSADPRIVQPQVATHNVIPHELPQPSVAPTFQPPITNPIIPRDVHRVVQQQEITPDAAPNVTPVEEPYVQRGTHIARNPPPSLTRPPLDQNGQPLRGSLASSIAKSATVTQTEKLPLKKANGIQRF